MSWTPTWTPSRTSRSAEPRAHGRPLENARTVLKTKGRKLSLPAFCTGWDRVAAVPMVEMGGIEPPSDVVLSGLLRAQFASDFLGPSYPANR